MSTGQSFELHNAHPHHNHKSWEIWYLMGGGGFVQFPKLFYDYQVILRMPKYGNMLLSMSVLFLQHILLVFKFLAPLAYFSGGGVIRWIQPDRQHIGLSVQTVLSDAKWWQNMKLKQLSSILSSAKLCKVHNHAK